MAGHQLIDTYLAALARRMSWRGDRVEVDAEVRDHLYSATERLEAQGLDSQAAQRRVLDRFGTPSVVAAAFATTGNRGVAVPTDFTTSAGTAAFVGSGAWLLLAVAWGVSEAFDRAQGWGTGSIISYMIGAVGLLAAAAVTTLVLLALDRRHGGLGIVGRIGAGLCGLGVAASLFGWFLPGWGSLIGAGTLLIAIGVVQRGMAPLIPTVLLGTAWGLAMGLFVALETGGFGRADEWGDHPLARVTAVGIGSLFSAAGLWGLGRWLASEQPADPDLIESQATIAG